MARAVVTREGQVAGGEDVAASRATLRRRACAAVVTAVPAPTAYRLVVPEGWWRVDLEPSRTDASVAALVDRQWRGVDDAPHLKAEARQLLREQAIQARAAAGVALYLSVGPVGGVPLPASLLVALLPLADPAELPGLVQGRVAAGADVSPVRLPAGDALRSRWREEPVPDDPSGNVLATTCLDLHVPVPGARHVLLLAFRTPMEPLADALVELFDSVATTLSFSSDPPSSPER
jgi:hypothetical protein